MNDALKQVSEASQLDKLLLPFTLLVIRLQLLVELLLVALIFVEIVGSLGESHIHELSLHDLQAV